VALRVRLGLSDSKRVGRIAFAEVGFFARLHDELFRELDGFMVSTYSSGKPYDLSRDPGLTP
jgi:hypothetical protein